MRALDDAFERLLLAVARRSGRVVATVALLLYPGVALIVPVVLGWPSAWLVGANLTGALLAAAVLLTWFGIRVQARDRRHLVEWTTDLRLLNAEEFEWLVGEIFRRDGWQVEETGRQDAPDGNIDLSLRKNGVRRIV